MEHGIVNRTPDGFFRYQAWPTVCKDENGVLYVGSSGHRLGHICPFGKNLMYVSRDEGKTWSAPRIINDSHLDDRDAGLTSLGNGKLLLTYFNLSRQRYLNREEVYVKRYPDPMAEALYRGALRVWEQMPDEYDHAGSFTRLSRDGGETWEAPNRAPVTSPHGPILLANGKLLFFGKEFCSGIYEEGSIYAFESADEGKSWQLLSKIEFPEGCSEHNIHEPYAIELPNGRLLAALRGDEPPVPYGFSVFLCHSDDGGKSWTRPRSLDVCGSPPHLLLHSSGAVILTYARRIRPYGQCARISYDGGETFGEEIVLRDDGPDWDLGYPSTAELSDGSLITVYYQKLKGDSFNSIQYTKWSFDTQK